MKDYIPRYLNAFLLAFATFAVIFAIFIAKDSKTSSHLYFSTSSSLWTSSFSSAFITVSIFLSFHPFRLYSMFLNSNFMFLFMFL